jgi:hypothetical protein
MFKEQIYDEFHHCITVDQSNVEDLKDSIKSQFESFEAQDLEINIKPKPRSEEEKQLDSLICVFSGNSLIQMIRYRYEVIPMNRRIELKDIKAISNDHLNRTLILMALNKVSQRQRASHVTCVSSKDRKEELEQIGFLTDMEDDKFLLSRIGIEIDQDQVLQ